MSDLDRLIDRHPEWPCPRCGYLVCSCSRVERTAICPGQRIADIVAGCNRFPEGGEWARRLRYMRPRNVLELGTGEGMSGTQILAALPADATFTTVDFYYPENGRHGDFLQPLRGDPRLRLVNADTREPASLALVPDGVDLLYLDTTHRAWHAALELRLWQDKLLDGAIVIVDDLGMHDMWAFWESLPYEKWPETATATQGFFRYDASRRYTVAFPEGRTSKEGEEC